MARTLKTYQTSLGFFDLAVAAPSMKAALKAWGADSNLFHQGAAKQSEDPDVIAATMSAPGVVLKRPVGSSGPFKEHAELPTNLAGDNISKKAGSSSARRKPQKHPKRATDRAADRQAALAFEKEQKRRERERAKEEAAQRKERERRQKASRQGAKRFGCGPSGERKERFGHSSSARGKIAGRRSPMGEGESSTGSRVETSARVRLTTFQNYNRKMQSSPDAESIQHQRQLIFVFRFEISKSGNRDSEQPDRLLWRQQLLQ
jgi:hypothetical protein